MLASGPRINPWLQEASQRRIESGDLVGFDTDMVGPLGYFCDISRTFHCGPAKPSQRQKQIYRLAFEEIQHNLKLVRPGIGFREIQDASFPIPENCQDNAYPCIIHGVGMCDRTGADYRRRLRNDVELSDGSRLTRLKTNNFKRSVSLNSTTLTS
jgi:Xaa-Pro aminopeptidase